MSRTPACEDAGIAERLREIQADRMAAIAGCACPPDGSGGQTHRPGCPLEPRPMLAQTSLGSPTQIALVIAAVERLRARARVADPGTVRLGSGCITAAFPPLLGPLLAMALSFDPHILTLSWGTDRPQETVAATSRSTCEQAAEAIRAGRWLADDPPLAMACKQGSAFPKGWDCIERFNCGEDRR